MKNRLDLLLNDLEKSFGNLIKKIIIDFDQVTVIVDSEVYIKVMIKLKDDVNFNFCQLIDLCCVDYSAYSEDFSGLRFAVVTHLLSTSKNLRLRVKTFAKNNDYPVIPSVTRIWSSADWYEREAFDLFGVLFEGHDDLRRILTDYGFIGHPFRKDFPVSGFVEMRYDPDQERVIYQPVTIDPRENVPRVIRENNYGSN
tara:strand:- start:16 stop:609 length:594 start_codon:yes stop_codon:yes gene_type:complete